MSTRTRRVWKLVLPLVLVVAAIVLERAGLIDLGSKPTPAPPGASGTAAPPVATPAPGREVDADEAAVVAAFRDGRSGLVVEIAGAVDRMLPDDDEGSPHQRFVLRLSGGHTVLVAHNIDLAPRVPIDLGDRVQLRGQYEWNDRGGVIHWTHHDPQGRRPGGWIDHDGERYR